MISVSNLSKSYNGVTVLNIENLDIPAGESFGLVGNRFNSAFKWLHKEQEYYC